MSTTTNNNILIIDNGSYTCRFGYTSPSPSTTTTNNNVEIKSIPNVTAQIKSDGRLLVGDDCEKPGLSHHELLDYKRPYQYGCFIDLQTEKLVWERALFKWLGSQPQNQSNTSLVLVETNPMITPYASEHLMDQFMFETMDFGSVVKLPSATTIANHYVKTYPNTLLAQSPIKIIVDIGYSCTWIVPVLGIQCIWSSAKRLDVGGKLLTNLMKEELSWRHVALMDETHLVENLKKQVCYLSNNLNAELIKPVAPATISYLLPDHVVDLEGRLLTPGEIPHPKRHVLKLGIERFLVPEVLFDPSRIGLNQAGLPEAISQCILSLPKEWQINAMENILVCGGTARLPNLKSRLETALRSWIPENYNNNTTTTTNSNQQQPILQVTMWCDDLTSSWKGAELLVKENKSLLFISKKEYLEYGTDGLRQKRRSIWVS
jgi:actin-related protein 6